VRHILGHSRLPTTGIYRTPNDDDPGDAIGRARAWRARMPVDFLTSEQAQRHGRYTVELNPRSAGSLFLVR
jgi:hypothetical protein